MTKYLSNTYIRYCDDCDELFKPASKGNYYCESCLVERKLAAKLKCIKIRKTKTYLKKKKQEYDMRRYNKNNPFMVRKGSMIDKIADSPKRNLIRNVVSKRK